MGMTGTGKTTIVNLLQRFYDVTSGRILLDGQDIRTIPLIQLRAAMSVVMQEVFLFSDSVSENVKTGRREDTDQEMVRWASDAAGASHFIENLSERYETVIDPKRHEVIKKDKWKTLSKQFNRLGILLLLAGCGLFLFYARSVGESRP